VEAQRCVELTGTNEPCGLTIFISLKQSRF
jgi:hypothetical protein